jgi:beta-adrenergic-receptor kinase
LCVFALHLQSKISLNISAAACKIVCDYLAPGSVGCTKRIEDKRFDTARSITGKATAQGERDSFISEHRNSRLSATGNNNPGNNSNSHDSQEALRVLAQLHISGAPSADSPGNIRRGSRSPVPQHNDLNVVNNSSPLMSQKGSKSPSSPNAAGNSNNNTSAAGQVSPTSPASPISPQRRSNDSNDPTGGPSEPTNNNNSNNNIPANTGSNKESQPTRLNRVSSRQSGDDSSAHLDSQRMSFGSFRSHHQVHPLNSEDAPGTTTVSDQVVRNESCSYNSNINISNNANVYHSSTEGGSSNYNNNNEDNLRQLMEALEFPETSYFFLEDTSRHKEQSEHAEAHKNASTGGNAISCRGQLVVSVIERIEQNRIQLDMFDELETLVFNYVKLRHFMQFVTQSIFFEKYLEYMSMLERSISEDDFPLFRVLGRGGFGLVSACKRAYSGKLYAIKVMSKNRVKFKKAEKLCLNERVILATVDSPFIVCLKYAFTTPTDLFLVLDLMMGGDLSFHLRRRGIFTVNESKYYASRILLGIAALHDLSIVYRDLKPENILLDEHGRTKLSDLGLAKKVTRAGLAGTCGTRGYWAPEMIRRDSEGRKQPYGLSVDWFSFGCCIYEFLIGVSPFRTERARNWGEHGAGTRAHQYHANQPDPQRNLNDVNHHIANAKDRAIDLAILEMEPDYMSMDEVSKDLLKKLLKKEPRDRLGFRGYKEVKRHPWFRDIDFDNLNVVDPPIIPGRDINMFTQSEIGTFNDDREARKTKLAETDHKCYENWSYVYPRANQEEIVEFLLKEEQLVRYVNS